MAMWSGTVGNASQTLATGLIEQNASNNLITIGNSGSLLVEGNTTLGNANSDTTSVKGPAHFESTLRADAGISLGANTYGTAGQVLTSGGGSASVNTWTTPTTGTVTSVATNNGLTGGTITTTGTLGILTTGTSNAIEFLTAATPASGDLVWFSDINDSNTLRKCTVADLQGPIGGPFLPLAGGTMAGAINMGTNNITNGGTATFTTFSGDLNGTINTATTAVTQSQGNNSTKVATTAYVDAAIGGSTLAEVLANGNTTGGTNIAVSANDDITFADDSQARFGTGNDLNIYHNTNSFIENSTGYLMMRSDTAIYLRSATGNEQYITCSKDAGVTVYYDDAAKLATTSSGISVTGNADLSGEVQVGGAGSLFAENVLRFYSAGTGYFDHNTTGQSMVFRVSGSSSLDTTALTLKSTGAIQANDYGSGNNTGTPAYNLQVDSSGNIIETGNVNPHGSGIYSFSDTVNASSNENIFSIACTHGAQTFTAYFTCNTTGISVAKTYTVAHSYGTTVTYNKLVDTGPYGGTATDDFTVTFTGSTDTITCNIANPSSTNLNIVTTIMLGGSPTTLTVTAL